MSSFVNPKSVKMTVQAVDLSSKLGQAILPVISKSLIEDMEQKQKAEHATKKEVQAVDSSSKPGQAILPIISKSLIENMEQKQKAEHTTKKEEKH